MIVWTFAVEMMWITKRKNFDIFGPMIFDYGRWDNGQQFTFNSETFFHEFCKHHGFLHWTFIEDGNPCFTNVLSEDWVYTLIR